MGRRLALLIATYQHQDSGLRQLTAPAADAEALAAVLRDPDIAGFEVSVLVNEPHYRVGAAIGEFYRNCRRDDLTLLYFTGHGLKDEEGRLYLAMCNTRRDSLLFTAVAAEQLSQAINIARSRQIVLILDCCYSGAFPAGYTAKADTEAHSLDKLQGQGRTVLTASDSMQYSFEGDQLHGDGARSVFTRCLVEGLRDGSADLDRDGNITLDELYAYVYERVVNEMPQQRPKKQDSVEGKIIIAQNINWTPPDYLLRALESPSTAARLAALDELTRLYRGGNPRVQAQVLAQIERIVEDDSKVVSAAASVALQAIRAASEPAAATTSTERSSANKDALAEQRENYIYPPVGGARSQAASPPPLSEWKMSPPPTGHEQTEAGMSTSGSTELPPAQGTPFKLFWYRHRQSIVGIVGLSLVLLVIIIVFIVIESQSSPSLRQAASVPVGQQPWGVAVAPDGGQLYITNEGSNSVSVIDTKTNTVTATVTVGHNPRGIVVAPDGRRVFVANFGSSSISLIDIASNAVTTTIPVDGSPENLALTPDGRYAYVANPFTSPVSVIDTTSNSVTATISIQADAITTAPEGHHAYAASADNMAVIDTTNNNVTATIPISPGASNVAATLDGRIYIAYNKRLQEVLKNLLQQRQQTLHGIIENLRPGPSDSATPQLPPEPDMSVIDTVSKKVTATIPIGDPSGLAIAPDGHYVYVANSAANAVSVIDTASNVVTSTIAVENAPQGVAFAPDGHHAYVTNSRSNTVSVIDTGA